MVTVESTPAVYAKVENRPGTLARAARILGERRINIEAVSLETQGSTGFARFVTQKPRETVEALRSAGVEAYESPLLIAQVQNRPGELAKLLAELSAAGINVEAVVTTPDGRVAFRTHDNEQASRILAKL